MRRRSDLRRLRGSHFRHQRAHSAQLLIECSAALRRDRLDDLPQDIVAGWIPGRDPRHSWIPSLLPPTHGPRRAFLQPVLLAAAIIGGFNIVHIMMAGKTLEL